jgi:hypothetical protein
MPYKVRNIYHLECSIEVFQSRTMPKTTCSLTFIQQWLASVSIGHPYPIGYCFQIIFLTLEILANIIMKPFALNGLKYPSIKKAFIFSIDGLILIAIR